MAKWKAAILDGLDGQAKASAPVNKLKAQLGLYASTFLGLPEGQVNKPGCVNALVRKTAEEIIERKA